MERSPTDTINDLLHLDLSVTARGDEAKGYCPDPEGPGRGRGGLDDLYLNKADCEALSQAFARLAKELNVPGHVKLY